MEAWLARKTQNTVSSAKLKSNKKLEMHLPDLEQIFLE